MQHYVYRYGPATGYLQYHGKHGWVADPAFAMAYDDPQAAVNTARRMQAYTDARVHVSGIAEMEWTGADRSLEPFFVHPGVDYYTECPEEYANEVARIVRLIKSGDRAGADQVAWYIPMFIRWPEVTVVNNLDGDEPPAWAPVREPDSSSVE